MSDTKHVLKSGSTLTPESQSPSFLTTAESQVYRHIHPVLILSIFYFSFSQLVADPVTTLIYTAVPLALLQLIYCIICLPPWSSTPAPTPPKKEPKDSKKGGGGAQGGGKDHSKPPKRVQFAKTAPTLASKIVPGMLSLLLSLALVPLITLLLILQGSSITSNHAGTLLLALHMVLLTCPPMVYVHGVDRRMWREIMTFSLPFDEMFGGTVGCVLGTLLGQVALPLDWDRPWQRWPVPLVVGAYGGWAAGRLIGEFLLKGRRIEFKSQDGKLDGE